MSFLSKFIRGAAEAGGQLYADMASTQMREKLLAAREEVLQANRMAITDKKQTFQSNQLTSRQEHDVTTAETLATGKVSTAETKFGYDKELAGIRATSGTKTSIDVIKVKSLVASGRVKTEAEAWDYITANKNVPVKDIFSYLKSQQNPDFGPALKKGDPGYMSIEDMITESKRLSSGVAKEDLTPKPDPDADTGKGSIVDTILKDFKGKASETEILNSIIKDNRLSAATREDAKLRLSSTPQVDIHQKIPPREDTTPEPVKEKFTDKADWHLLPNVPTEARKQMTAAMKKERFAFYDAKRDKDKVSLSENKEIAKNELKTLYPTMTDDEKTKWRSENLKYLDSSDRRAILKN